MAEEYAAGNGALRVSRPTLPWNQGSAAEKQTQAGLCSIPWPCFVKKMR